MAKTIRTLDSSGLFKRLDQVVIKNGEKCRLKCDDEGFYGEGKRGKIMYRIENGDDIEIGHHPFKDRSIFKKQSYKIKF